MLGYGSGGCLARDAPEAEWKARNPTFTLGEVVSPTFIIEGSGGNASSLPYFRKYRGSAPVEIVEIPNGNHFTTLAPGCEAVAKAILADTGSKPSLSLSADAISERLAKHD
ncbi:MAG: hypothetical protein QM756_33460 [Polyangiaceae bacterium]